MQVRTEKIGHNRLISNQNSCDVVLSEASNSGRKTTKRFTDGVSAVEDPFNSVEVWQTRNIHGQGRRTYRTGCDGAKPCVFLGQMGWLIIGIYHYY